MYMKPVKKVEVDSYLAHKDKYKEMSEYMTVKPVDMLGHCVPLGKSVADKSRNIKAVQADLNERTGSYY